MKHLLAPPFTTCNFWFLSLL